MLKFEEKFGQTIDYSYISKLLLQKFGRPYRGINSVLQKKEHIEQRLEFAGQIIRKGKKSSDIMLTDECRVILFPKVNPKINAIRLSEEDNKNISFF